MQRWHVLGIIGLMSLLIPSASRADHEERAVRRVSSQRRCTDAERRHPSSREYRSRYHYRDRYDRYDGWNFGSYRRSYGRARIHIRISSHPRYEVTPVAVGPEERVPEQTLEVVNTTRWTARVKYRDEILATLEPGGSAGDRTSIPLRPKYEAELLVVVKNKPVWDPVVIRNNDQNNGLEVIARHR